MVKQRIKTMKKILRDMLKRKCRHEWETHWYDFNEFKKNFPVAGRQHCRKCGATRIFKPLCMPFDENGE
jgi:hypothetical protein